MRVSHIIGNHIHFQNVVRCCLGNELIWTYFLFFGLHITQKYSTGRPQNEAILLWQHTGVYQNVVRCYSLCNVSIYGWEVPTASCAMSPLSSSVHHSLNTASNGRAGNMAKFFQSTWVQIFFINVLLQNKFIVHKHVLQSTQITCTYTTAIF